MTIHCQKIVNSAENQNFFFVKFEDETQKDPKLIEKIKIPFYVSPEDAKAMPILLQSFDDLPKFLEMVYKSGKNGEELKFVEDSVDM